ncbi:MAG: hypothetical protein KDK59_07435 [Simkania sp.]|nr:hypothetical protein [Simkania sp.]
MSDIQYLRVNSFSEKMTPVASLYESLYLIIFINIFVSTAIVFYLIDKERKHDFMYHSRHSNTFKSITLAETHEVLELEYKRLVTEYPKIKKHIAKAYSYKKSLLDPLLAPIYSKAVHDIQNATDFQDLDSKYYAAIRTHPEIGNRLTKLFKQEKLKFNKK